MTKRRMKKCRNFIGVGIQNTGIRIVDPFNSYPTISPLNILLQELDQLQFGHPRWQERDELAARVRFVLDFMKEKQTRDCCGFLVPSKSNRCRNLSIEKERRNPMFQTLLHESKLQKSRLFENPLKILQSKHNLSRLRCSLLLRDQHMNQVFPVPKDINALVTEKWLGLVQSSIRIQKQQKMVRPQCLMQCLGHFVTSQANILAHKINKPTSKLNELST